MNYMPLLLPIFSMDHMFSFHQTIFISEKKLMTVKGSQYQFTTAGINGTHVNLLIGVAYPKRIDYAIAVVRKYY